MREAGFGDMDADGGRVEMMREAEFGIGLASLGGLFDAFRPEMEKAPVRWSREELDEFKAAFLAEAEKGAVEIDAGRSRLRHWGVVD